MPNDAGNLRLVVGDEGEDRTLVPSVGVAQIHTHFGEFLQGMFHMPWGPTRGLVSAPCPAFRSVVEVELSRREQDVRSEPAGLSKAIAAAKLTLKYLGASDYGAVIRVDSNIEQGIGAGSSTGDVVATIVATSTAMRRRLSEQEIAVLTVETEKAADSTMFIAAPGQVRLFAHRMGMTLEVFERGFPPIEIVGIVDGSPVDTLSHPPANYANRTIFEFDILREALRGALRRSDCGAFGEISTRSAEINQEFLPKPRFDCWIRLFQRYGAVGLAVSHSGSAVSFLFDRHDVDRSVRIGELLGELGSLGVKPTVRYELGASNRRKAKIK